MPRQAYYICTNTSYCVFETDRVTEIAEFWAHDLPPGDVEIGDEHPGTYDETDNTFTFDNGGTIQL